MNKLLTIVFCITGILTTAYGQLCVTPPPATIIHSATGDVAGFFTTAEESGGFTYVIMKGVLWVESNTGIQVYGQTRDCGYFAYKNSDKQMTAVLMDAKNNQTRMQIRCVERRPNGDLVIAWVAPVAP